MLFEILTLFPEAVEGYLGASIIGRARQVGLIEVVVTNIRDFAHDKHRTADDRPFGGGDGMVMKPEPLAEAIKAALPGRVILASPRGERLNQAKVGDLAGWDKLILVCGRYEGVDQRVIDLYVDEEISCGDYVITGGELAAMIMVDATARLIPGVLGAEGSAEEESFSDGLLEYPQYTRPREFEGQGVPEILFSGDHAAIREWRRRESIRATAERRPEMLEAVDLNRTERAWVQEMTEELTGESARKGDLE